MNDLSAEPKEVLVEIPEAPSWVPPTLSELSDTTEEDSHTPADIFFMQYAVCILVLTTLLILRLCNQPLCASVTGTFGLCRCAGSAMDATTAAHCRNTVELTVGKWKFCMDFGFPAMLALIFLSGNTAFLLQTLLVCILHELGHGIAMYLTHAGLREIRFCGAGVQIVAGTAVLSRSQSLCISLAGPLVNLLCAAWFARSAAGTAALHLCMGLFNLLPYHCLDGGTAIRIYWDSRILSLLCMLLSAVLFVLLCILNIRNPLLYLLLLYLTVNEWR